MHERDSRCWCSITLSGFGFCPFVVVAFLYYGSLDIHVGAWKKPHSASIQWWLMLWIQGVWQTPVWSCHRGVSSKFILPVLFALLESILVKSTEPCCSTGTDMHPQTAGRLCLLFNWKMNIFVIPIPRPSGASAHYQVTGSRKPHWNLF